MSHFFPGKESLRTTVDNHGFSRNETGEKIRISGLLRLEEMGLEVLLVCLLAVRSTQDPILLTFNFWKLVSFNPYFL